MVIACSTESRTLRAQPGEPSQPTNDKCEVNLVYEPSERKESQMRNNEDVTIKNKDRLEPNWRSEVDIVDTFVDLKTNVTRRYLILSRCEIVTWAELILQIIESS